MRVGAGGIAYQVIGRSPIDRLFAGGQFSTDLIWEDSSCARFLRRLASFSRPILFDPTSFGGSDHTDPA
jgi:hypothetical protein